MRATFRADASVEMGSGHIMRCLTLADSLAEANLDCRFAVRPGSVEAAPALAHSGYEIFILEDDIKQEAAALRRYWPEGSDWLIVDHYDRDKTFESACRPWASQIMAIDDLADRPHDCNLLLDQTLNRGATDYIKLVPEDCRLLLGTRYALLRGEFAALRRQRREAKTASLRLLVSLGGTDPSGITKLVLDGIEQSDLDAEVDVVMGASSPALAEVTERVERTEGQRLHVNPGNMSDLMAAANLAIGAAGTSSWERCCIGLPTIMMVLADNQRENARQLSAAGAVKLLDPAGTGMADAIAGALRALAADRNRLQHMSQHAAALCDGQGALRARLTFLPAQPGKDRKDVTLRLAEPEDEATLLYWQQQPAIRNLARNPRIPTEEEHRDWFTARMASEDCFIAMIEHGGATAGMLRLDRVADSRQRPAFEVSILVDEQHRGAGVARGALRLIRQWLPTAEFHAETLPGNTASIALFQSVGYTELEGNVLCSRVAS